jgi:hypothetical protein
VRFGHQPVVVTSLFVATATSAAVHIVVLTRLLPGPLYGLLIALVTFHAVALALLGRLATRWPFSAHVNDGHFTLRYLHRRDRIALAEIVSIRTSRRTEAYVERNQSTSTGAFRFRARMASSLDISTPSRRLRISLSDDKCGRLADMLGGERLEAHRPEISGADPRWQVVPQSWTPEIGRAMLGIFGLEALLMSLVFVSSGLFVDRSIVTTTETAARQEAARVKQWFPAPSSTEGVTTQIDVERCNTYEWADMSSTPASWRLSVRAISTAPTVLLGEIPDPWVGDVDQQLGVQGFRNSSPLHIRTERSVDTRVVVVSSICVTATKKQRQRLLSVFADLATRIIMSGSGAK